VCKRILLALAVVMGCAAGAEAQTTVKLCAAVGTGCNATATMSNLQGAVNTAAASSSATVIYIQNGATLTGGLVLPHRAVGVTAYVTIRSGVDSAGNLTSGSIWPDPADRLWPASYTGVSNESGHATNYTGSLAKMIAVGSNESTIRTVLPSEGAAAPLCIAHHYKIELIDVSSPVPPDAAAGPILLLGSQAVSSDVPAGNTQNLAAEEPHDITLSQMYIHGTDAGGCLHGVMVAAKDVIIQHSYISNCWWGGSDAQAVWWINTTGGLTMTNNYVEGSGENFIAGGDTPRMNFTTAGITLSASTTTTATLTAALPDYMRTGDCVSVLVSGVKAQGCIASIDPSGGNPRRLITFSPALAAAPNVPGSMKGGVVMRDMTATGNWFNTPVSWRGTTKGNTRKNLFELKNARNVTVTGNLFTNVWHIGQNGYAIVFTPINQDGGNDSTQVANVVFSFNRVQHMVGCFNISGVDGDGFFSQRTTGIAVSHTSCEDMSTTTWGTATFPAVAIGGGRVPARMMPTDLSFDHMLFDHRAGAWMFQWSIDTTDTATVVKSVFTLKNSIIRNPGSYAFAFYSEPEGGHTSGLTSWNYVVTGGTCLNNSWAQESAANWAFCTGSVFPATNAIQDGALVNPVGGDFSVDQGCGSPSATCYDNAGNDGADLGPNWSILSDYYNDALNGTPGGGETPPPDPDPTPPNYEEMTLNKMYSPAGTNFVLESAGDVVMNPVGKEVIPGAGYDISIGRGNRKFSQLFVSEAVFSTLVTDNYMATIGGRIMVAPSTVLTSDLGAGDTTIAVKHNNLQNGDRIYLEAGGTVEFMAVTSSASGGGPFTYSVGRSLDPTGPNDWNAGDGIVNTGQTGNGFWDIYSNRGVKASTEIGPTIVANVRTGSTYNAWEPRAAVGNLDGLYGYTGTTYGAAFGVPSGARLTITPDDGIRIFGSDNDLKLDIDASGNATFDGRVTIGASRNMLTNSECRVSTEGWSLNHNTGLSVIFGFGYAGWRLLGESNTCYLHGFDFVPAAGTYMQAISDSFAAAAGQVYEASVYLGMHRTAGAIFIQFLDEANGIVASNTGNTCFESNGNGGPLLAGYCRSYLVATAPVGTAKVRTFIRATMNGAEDDPYMFFVRAYLAEGKPGQTQVSEWGPAGITEITNGMIRTDAITTRTIAANSINADKIQFGVITGDHIVAHSVRAENLTVTELSAITANLGTVNAGTLNSVAINSSTLNSANIYGGLININGGAFSVNPSGDMSANLATMQTGTAIHFVVSTDLYLMGSLPASNRFLCVSTAGLVYPCTTPAPEPEPAMARVEDLERRIGELEAALRATERK
jgi:hypothetical protein